MKVQYDEKLRDIIFNYYLTLMSDKDAKFIKDNKENFCSYDLDAERASFFLDQHQYVFYAVKSTKLRKFKFG